MISLSEVKSKIQKDLTMIEKSIPNYYKIIVLIIAICGYLSSINANEWTGTIWPTNAPDWVKKHFEVISKESKFYDNRTWPKIGVPGGLEEQVWKSWAPGTPPVWRNIAPGFTNVIMDAKINNGSITVLLDLAGLMQSRDGGKSWRQISHHLPNGQNLSFDTSPTDSNLMVVGGGYIGFTRNGGRSWNIAYDKVLPEFGKKSYSPFNQVRFNSDGSRLFLGIGRCTPQDFHVGERFEKSWKLKDSFSRKCIYVADGQLKKFKKIDLGAFAPCRCILPHPKNPNLVYASFSDGSIYKCSNADQEKLSFDKLKLPQSFNGLQCVRIDISPVNPNELLLIMYPVAESKFKAKKTKLFHAQLDGSNISAVEISPNVPYGIIKDARWNPHNPKQVFVGVDARPSIMLTSEDGMKTFRRIPFPENLKYEEIPFYWSPSLFTFDRKSNMSMVRSLVGAWVSRDGFKNMKNLMMKYNPETRQYGNKGVGAAECVDSIAARDKYTYIGITDHGVFRSNGKDISQWTRISWNRPGLPIVKGKPFRGQANIIGVSDDEKYVYQVLRMRNYGINNLKIMQSIDQGNTWKDITKRFGKGDEISINQYVQQIMFDPRNSKRQWFLFWKTLFYSIDGGKTFKEKKFNRQVLRSAGSNAMAYDPVHGVLYLSQIVKVLRSFDFGETWETLKIKPCANVGGVGVLDNGDLVLGMRGALVVIPYEKISSGKIEPEMVRMTLGEKTDDFAMNRFDFRGIYCKGKYIIASTFATSRGSCNSARKLGLLFSNDRGKTFKWISYNLPWNGIGSIDMRNGRIILGAKTLYTTTLDKFMKGD